ncbi:TetR/AcrR family transcriptional regulator [Vagococcus fluvialis]|jgi:AcrR family transcriptional regulator|uniref:TetR/AcrR family transcriptional regulator n=1 Tax=Vagococcus fluvialis TaxID=2738 RepID=A0A7X6D8L5_9ENTE|nr:TetR/AcrR family transcriptional regulator [Vagococcus fluvialis]MDR2278025.1 TetR/AcrR family transcriptional regulator [Vagococcus sp.]MBO0427716.1 TetR/AcrR family transcriptional regulator [Vagococcus fluvialis]MBO0442098.1 TetR/AcrR family transcriptional regulator [Vagococcus fluvialis]MBO0480541.1 TetR/AcrR family transcriptional regulator [Vagococcus fluvialis]MBO0485670.1 TetR/AcrR family transcriptional regulator [Vagococcus fluvialis]
MKKQDLRVIRTKKMIIEAFLELIGEKGYEAITIQEIADKAMINRATFYAHFKDKPDLYDYVMNFAISNLSSILDSSSLNKSKFIHLKTIEKTLTRVFTMIKEQQTFFVMLTEGSSSELFRKKLSTVLATTYEETFSKLRITENDIEVPMSFIIEYMTSIFIGTVHWWVTTDSDFEPDHMARLVIKLVGNGHLTVLGIDIME